MTAGSPQQALSDELGLLHGVDTLLGSFLRAVSHDLKSPLLTLSLSAELLGDVFPDDERGRVAREALTHGLRDMERMLDAVTDVSRARRRVLQEQPSRLVDALTGHIVLTDAVEVDRTLLRVDVRSVADALRAIGDGGTVEVRLEAFEGGVALTAALPDEVAEVEGSAVSALLGSLAQYAGTPIAGLATCEVLLARQGGTLACEGGRVRLGVPVATAGRAS